MPRTMCEFGGILGDPAVVDHDHLDRCNAGACAAIEARQRRVNGNWPKAGTMTDTTGWSDIGTRMPRGSTGSMAGAGAWGGASRRSRFARSQ